MPIVVGDARLTMADETEGIYNLIILDAFSSDAIPLHLLTSEAIGLYLDKLTIRGAIAFHISNRHMRLAEVVSAVAATHGLVTYSLLKIPGKDAGSFDEPSIVAIAARNIDDLGVIATEGVWQKVPDDIGVKPWTDDYSNITDAIYRHYSGSYEKH